MYMQSHLDRITFILSAMTVDLFPPCPVFSLRSLLHLSVSDSALLVLPLASSSALHLVLGSESTSGQQPVCCQWQQTMVWPQT